MRHILAFCFYCYSSFEQLNVKPNIDQVTFASSNTQLKNEQKMKQNLHAVF